MKNKKVLIVDDDKDLNLLISQKVHQAGFEALPAFDGFQATRLALKEDPDLIILDIELPAGGGVEILKNLKQSIKTWNIPVIIITAHEEPEIKEEVSKLNIAGFIQKPFDPDIIIKKVKEIIGE